MNNIHSKLPIDMGLFHRIDINLYPLFIAIYEQKVFQKQLKSCRLRSLLPVMPCSVYVAI